MWLQSIFFFSKHLVSSSHVSKRYFSGCKDHFFRICSTIFSRNSIAQQNISWLTQYSLYSWKKKRKYPTNKPNSKKKKRKTQKAEHKMVFDFYLRPNFRSLFHIISIGKSHWPTEHVNTHIYMENFPMIHSFGRSIIWLLSILFSIALSI